MNRVVIRCRVASALLLFCCLSGVAAAQDPAAAHQVSSPQATGVIGVVDAQLKPDYWIKRQQDPDAQVLDRQKIQDQNTRLLAKDASTRDIEQLPATLASEQVKAWMDAMSSRPSRTLYGQDGKVIDKQQIDGWMADLDMASVPATQATRYGLVVNRSPLRTFPTLTRVFSKPGDTDIDRFQENAFFPGTPVAIMHASRDGQWWFVVGDLYTAWIQKKDVAEGGKAEVFAYTRKQPYLVVTGPTVHTTRTPDLPQVSDLQLDMGIRVPWLRDWPGDKPVNGQAAYTSYVVELPIRNAQGKLEIAPALIPRTADVSPDYLPLTRANLIRQGFKFLGERYGWGHDYDTRDCSGFVSEVYRSMGVNLPRNTSDQGKSPVLNRIAFEPADGKARRDAAVKDLQVGDLVYIPGHVMMVIGFDNGMPYMIHDTNGGSWLGADGKLVHGQLNGVSVTPLTPMRMNEQQTYVDRITNIQRIRP